MRRLLIIWWSMTGGSRALAEAAARGARKTLTEGDLAGTGGKAVEILVMRADQADASMVLDADALLFVTPENLGSMAGMMKDFFDRCWYAVVERINGRAWTAIVCAGTDGSATLRQLERFATGWRLRKVIEPLTVVTGAQTPEAIRAHKTIDPVRIAAAEALGATLAGGLAAGIW